MTVELNYSDEPGRTDHDQNYRRYAQLAWYLRAHLIVDVDCWSRVPGVPLRPGVIADELRRRITLT